MHTPPLRTKQTNQHRSMYDMLIYAMKVKTRIGYMQQKPVEGPLLRVQKAELRLDMLGNAEFDNFTASWAATNIPQGAPI